MSDEPLPYWHSLTTPEARTFCALDPVVILPVAAVEQHGPHLPLSTDLDIGLGLLREAFRRLPEDVPARVLPPIAVGTSPEHTRYPGTLSLRPASLEAVLAEYGASLARAGVRRLVISNSHGGNRHTIETAALQLRADHGLLVVKAHYFLLPRPEATGLPEREWRHGLHGGAVETAMMLFLHPEAVRREAMRAAPSLGAELERVLEVVEPANDAASFAWLAEDLNETGVTGDAHVADAALGRLLVEHYGAHLATVIHDARRFPVERLVRD